ncbi:hypothetical protein [Rodentibacter caecimuris]|nr:MULTISPECIES: hypothetical protein [Pasteurellaceae]AOF54447.1 hypothetical protein AC062_2361 [Pasteurellaceae bacterium NI1060]MCR1838525.1 hypothetical protein [Pasteurella caecimuris]MCU0107836.1 hypothetical protein [Pasteurella caecimuris]
MWWMFIIKKLSANLLAYGFKHLNKIAVFFVAIFVMALLYIQHANKLNIERQSAVINSLHEKVIQRDKIIDELHEDVGEQRKIAEKRLEQEQTIREQSYAQIQSIKKMLESNQCSDVTLPAGVVNELRK